MARPRKDTDAQRGRRFTLRLTADEYAALLARAAQANMVPSEYARQAVLFGRVKIIQTPPALPFAAIEELRRIGVNLNQLARIGNATGNMPGRLPFVLDQVNALLDEAMDRDMDRLEELDAKDATDPAVLTGE
jgi:hypothetical protein